MRAQLKICTEADYLQAHLTVIETRGKSPTLHNVNQRVTSLLKKWILEKRERRLAEISDEIFSSTSNSLDAKLQDIEQFVMRRLGDIHGLLTGDVPRAKSELAKHCAEITLTPEGQTYQISGDWNLLGGRSDGAGGTDCT